LEFKINKTSLELLINQLQNFLEKKDLSQITSCVLFEAKDDKLKTKATDYEIGISLLISNIEILEEGSVAFSGKKLFDIIKNFKNEEIIIKTIDDQVMIKQNRTTLKLPYMKSDEFPEFPNKENKKVLNIKNYDISNILKVISYSIDNNNTKYELNGMLLSVKDDKVSFISTDSKRLTVSNIDNPNSDEVHKIIIPKKTINEIIKLFSKDINIFFNKTYLIIEKNNIFFFSKLINGTYPDFERMIPQEYKYKIRLDKKELIENINIIQSVSLDIKMIFKENKILFENLNNKNIEAKTEMGIDNTSFDEESFIAINGKFILDFIQNIEEDSILFKFTDQEKPIEIEAKETRVVIMTIKEFN